MIRIRANRDWEFVELHIEGTSSVTFPGHQCITIKHLDNLIDTLLEVQRFVKTIPEESTRKWEVR